MELENAQKLFEDIERENEQKEIEKKYGKNSFNPQFDFLLQYPNGQTLASVYGKIWRYCQMSKGKCQASKQRMAEELNLSTKTVERAIHWLSGNGLVIDLTPEYGRTRPHFYQINDDEHSLQTIAFNQFRNEEYPKMEIFE